MSPFFRNIHEKFVENKIGSLADGDVAFDFKADDQLVTVVFLDDTIVIDVEKDGKTTHYSWRFTAEELADENVDHANVFFSHLPGTWL